MKKFKTIIALALAAIAAALLIAPATTAAAASPDATIHALAIAPAPLLAQVDTPADTGSTLAAILSKIFIWYGIAGFAFNGLTVFVSTIVKQTPGTSDDEAIDKLYASKPYKAIAWIFSWGDYIAEAIAKLKSG